ncbi:hypothetical protein [Deinococcus humi]|uniref:Uncharacterized protein n=1 Tax=Deinococcus humi TaxID=662880 RepID=A0A7W8K025_9DEIO|nr:hypothetical protein [Deinococcus humi]MBB5366382.1 hypothetical protein [Deinococcus humi]
MRELYRSSLMELDRAIEETENLLAISDAFITLIDKLLGELEDLHISEAERRQRLATLQA